MTLATYAFFAFLGVVGFAVLAGPICNFIEDVANGSDGGHGRRLREFHDARRAAGVSYSERMDELFLREKLAFYRRMASDAVGRDPTRWLEHMDEARKLTLEAIESERPELLLPFCAAVKELNFGHVLYPAESRLVERLCLSDVQYTGPTEDQIAALRIVSR